MQKEPWQGIVRELAPRLDLSGLDLCQPFSIGAYNRSRGQARPIEDFQDPQNLAVLVGNSRALWAPFCRAYAERPELSSAEGPLDRYVETALRESLVGLKARWVVVLGHQGQRTATQGESPFVSMQRAAEVSGLAYLAPTGLGIHPRLGPWFALRAVVSFDIPGPGRVEPLADPCSGCAERCLPLAETAQGLGSPKERWRAWVAVREACSVGAGFRYSDDQIQYHYTHDRSVLPLPWRSSS